MPRRVKPFYRLLLMWMEVLKRCSVEPGEGYGVLMCAMVLGRSGWCFAAIGMSQVALFERCPAERWKAGLWPVGGGYQQIQEIERMLTFGND